MNYLNSKAKIDITTKTELVSNKLVVIVPADAKQIPKSAKELAAYKHVALAGESVPAGKFARDALASENLLPGNFSKQIVNADNVRVALTWVATHEAEAGIVYSTDAIIEPKVKVAFSFKENTYPKIIYPAAVVSGSLQPEAALKFLEFCKSKKAQEIFMKAGFILL
jgi:molybdate transport system substrate-binding protein